MTTGTEGVWAAEVARYYDSNTRRFLLLGRGGDTHTMHRELWGPGVVSAEGAVAHVDTLLADEIERLAPESPAAIVDFGCGVGGTLFRLGRRFPDASLAGVTVSGRQVEIADRLAHESGLAARCSFELDDFHDVDLGVRADALVAVESFAHSDRPAAFLRNAARHLEPDGHLLVVDDFLASERLDGRQRALLGQFRAGWRVPGVCTVERLVEVAAGEGLEAVRTADLTALTRPGSRARDWVVAALSPLLSRLGLVGLPLCGNMIGGNALQVGLREGFLRYCMVVLRRAA